MVVIVLLCCSSSSEQKQLVSATTVRLYLTERSDFFPRNCLWELSSTNFIYIFIELKMHFKILSGLK